MQTMSVSNSGHHRHPTRRRALWRPTALAACTLGLLVACGGGDGDGDGDGGGGGGSSAPATYTTATSSVLAGSGTYGYTNHADPLQARFTRIWGLTGDGAGNLYVADFDSGAMRYVGSNGAVGTYAGAEPPGGGAYFDNPNPLVARFYGPAQLVRASNGTLYVADSNNHCIRKIAPGANATTAGAVTTVAGVCGTTTEGFNNGVASTARFRFPFGLALDEAQQVLYVADTENNRIRKIKLGSLAAADAVTTLAGNEAYGSADGQGSAARFYHPQGLARDAQGNLFVADGFNSTIRKVDANGQVSTLAGTPQQRGYANGAGSGAKFYGPAGVAADANGSIYVADRGNNVIRMLRPNGSGGYTASTLAGAQPTNGKDPAPPGAGIGSAAATQFKEVTALWLDGKGMLYTGERDGSRIVKLTLQR